MDMSVLQQALDYGRQYVWQGKVADYIPQLGKADSHQLGIAIFTTDGQRLCCGDCEQRFTIQSISKVISLAIALEHKGFDTVFSKVKMEPSGDAFNSIVKLDLVGSQPFNPMLNAGAIVVTGFLEPDFTFEDLLLRTKELCLDDNIELDESVYLSEKSTGSRNRSIAYLLNSKGILECDVENCLDLYFHMCSLSVTAQSLAGLGLVMANGGIHPVTGKQLLRPEVVRVLKTLMLTCGMYDGSGEYAVRVGIPSKSGVGGGILSCVCGEMGIGVFGPSLDEKGNSIGGRYMLEYLSRQQHLHIFDR